MSKKCLLLFAVLCAFPMSLRAQDYFVYFGSQSKEPGIGFSLARFDDVTGTLTKPKFLLEADAPSFFIIHPDGKHLYSTNFSGVGGISAYQIDPKTGALSLINRISGNNASTTFVGLDREGKTVLTANFAA